jgi:hypothetical protein
MDIVTLVFGCDPAPRGRKFLVNGWLSSSGNNCVRGEGTAKLSNLICMGHLVV